MLILWENVGTKFLFNFVGGKTSEGASLWVGFTVCAFKIQMKDGMP